jgi:hypothetical protein
MRHLLNNVINKIGTLQRKHKFMNEAQKLFDNHATPVCIRVFYIRCTIPRNEL